jgi:2-aminophenol/2-amino-5-chlorophenol 1,6-dioxygenase alpha subunit
VLLLSTQWFTVLGHQVQCDSRLRGTRTDENWYRYDYGHLSHDLAVDVELAHAWADAIDAAGMQARRTRYDGFPIDTGTVTATRLLDPEHEGRWAIVSCNLYAEPSAMGEVARAGVAAAGDRRVAVVAVSGLSSGLIPRWITPAEDGFADAEHDRWNRKVLEAIRDGDDVGRLADEYARAAQVDSQFRAYAFLAGSGAVRGPGEVLAYGPVWGTGAAVVWWAGVSWEGRRA